MKDENNSLAFPLEVGHNGNKDSDEFIRFFHQRF
jgi:hypothetical protein